MFNPQCLRPNRTASNYTTKFCSFFLFCQHSENQKKCLLNAVLQYMQPTEFYTPVSTTVQPTCTYGSTEFSGTALFRCRSFAYLHAYFANVCFKIKNVDKIKNVKKRKNLTKIKNVKNVFLHLWCKPTPVSNTVNNTVYTDPKSQTCLLPCCTKPYR